MNSLGRESGCESRVQATHGAAATGDRQDHVAGGQPIQLFGPTVWVSLGVLTVIQLACFTLVYGVYPLLLANGAVVLAMLSSSAARFPRREKT